MNKTLIVNVKELVKEVDKTHRYSMSRIYGLYNEVFEKNEEPQSCASCLIRKVKELRDWLESSSGELDTVTPEAPHVEAASVSNPVKNRLKKKK